MKKPVSKEINRKNLLDCARLLRNVEYCFFYGSLLGIHRDGDVIEDDDDVDVLLSEKDDELVTNILLEGGYFLSKQYRCDKIFKQFFKTIDGTQVFLDLYFFKNFNEDYIIERWNFHARPYENNYHIIIPKPIIFPIKETIFKGKKIKIPNKPEKVCRYLYGENFSTPLKKELEYYIIIENNRPCIKLK